jgi:protein-S-isoprenylcysteine O-methyltransferase Ste14
VTTPEKLRVIPFFTLMILFAFVLEKMNVVADWFVKMRITDPADGINRLLNYIPLALVVILFLFVWGFDRSRKSRERTNS